MSDRHEVVEQLLGPRYVWAVHTEPVRRLIAYIRTLEEKVGELQHVKPCECPPLPEPIRWGLNSGGCGI